MNDRLLDTSNVLVLLHYVHIRKYSSKSFTILFTMCICVPQKVWNPQKLWAYKYYTNTPLNKMYQVLKFWTTIRRNNFKPRIRET